MPDQEEIKQQQELLQTYRRNLKTLLAQQAEHGGIDTPIHIVNNIRKTRADIQRTKAILRTWSQTIEDLPTDTEDSPTNNQSLPITPVKSQSNRTPIFIGFAVMLAAVIGIIFLPRLNLTGNTSFTYQVRIISSTTKAPIPGAHVAISTQNTAPIRSNTDSDGFARLFIPSDLANQPGVLSVEADGNQRYTLEIDLFQEKLPTVIELKSIDPAPTPQPPIPTPAPTQQPPTPAPSPSPVSQLEREAAANALLTEASAWATTQSYTFDTDTQGWPTEPTTDAYADVTPSSQDGRYRLEAKARQEQGTIAFEDHSPIPELTDFMLTADITKESGPNDTNVGILFRMDQQGQFYRFRINPADQTFAAIKLLSGAVTTRFIEPTRSVYINANGPNRLTIIARGNKFVFFINDHFVGDFTDDALQKGYINLSIGIPRIDSAAFSFDNIEIRTPPTP